MIGCCLYLRSQNLAAGVRRAAKPGGFHLNGRIWVLFGDLCSEMSGMNYSIGSSYELVSSLIEDTQSAKLHLPEHSELKLEHVMLAITLVCRVYRGEECMLWWW